VNTVDNNIEQKTANKEHVHGHYGALWALTDGQRTRYFGAIAVMFAATGFTYAMPLIVKWCIDGIVAGEFAGIESFASLADLNHHLYLVGAALAVVLCTSIGGGLTYLRGRWAAIASQEITRKIRDRLYTHLEHLPATFHDNAEAGDLIQRCSSDVETLRTFLAGQIVQIGRTVIMVFTVAPILFWMDVQLAMVSLVLMPFIFFFAFRFFTKVKTLFQVRDEAEAAMSAQLQENLTGIRVVRAFARQQYEMDQFAVKNQAFRDNDQRLNVIMAFYWTLSDFLSMAQMGLVLIVGALWLMNGDITVGTLFAFYTYVGMVIWPIRHLGRVLQDVGKAIVALGRLNHILEETEESHNEPDPAVPILGDIRISNLSFGYAPGETVLSDISLHIKEGETVALLGPPGCGKSTLIHLLMRLYDYSDGTIAVNGMDLRDIPRKILRTNIGVVMQEPFLYSKSIGDNLRVGKHGATESELMDAADEAAIAGAIKRFRKGLHSMVGERGVTLSGGQRQRLALARALISDPAILILDDALSAVDTGTEQHILKALAERKGRATTIVIAHRLSSVANADRIAVMDDGKIVQLGSHNELVQQNGPYRRLCSLQADFEATLDSDLNTTEENVHG
jgi:ATP-binding cassette, subfamily B, bacterial